VLGVVVTVDVGKEVDDVMDVDTMVSVEEWFVETNSAVVVGDVDAGVVRSAVVGMIEVVGNVESVVIIVAVGVGVVVSVRISVVVLVIVVVVVAAVALVAVV
jgi:hypothetical protein